MDGRTFKGKIAQAGGGVGRNIADALGKLGTSPFLISAVGNDEFGNFIMTQTIPHLNPNGISRLRDVTTGTCMVLCDHTGECLFVVGDMDIHERITEDQIKRFEKTIAESSLVVLDGNLSQETLEFALILCQKHSVPAWYEPTDYFRAHKPFLKSSVPQPNFISPNIQEFFKIYETIFKREAKPDESNIVQSCIAKGYEMSDFIDNIIITLGKEGVLIIRKGDSSDPFFTNSNKPRYIKKEGSVTHRLYHPELVAESDIVNVSGAGDCFVSGFVAAMLRGESEKSCIKLGFKCSAASLKCFKPVPANFSET